MLGYGVEVDGFWPVRLSERWGVWVRAEWERVFFFDVF